MKKICTILALALLLPWGAAAEEDPQSRILTLDECRQLAVGNSRDLDQARTKVEMAGYDRKIAMANYFPEISATGAYMYTYKNPQLISEDIVTRAWTAGKLADSFLESAEGRQLISILEEATGTSIGHVSISGPIQNIAQEIHDAFEVDIHNLFIGAVTLKQPVFVGGKIVNANRMAALAEELSVAGYDMQYAQTVTDVDEAYWQIVAIAGKKRLASAYADLLHKLEKDAAVGMDAGVKTKSDLLQIKVKANEADLLLTQATNGLALSKMLLCQKTGLPLQTQITLADEDVEVIPVPAAMDYKDMDSILEDRPETRSLALASQIYLRQADMARADMMPRVALMGNFYITNPSAYNGFQKEWGSNFSVGVMVQIPIFHGFEALQKTRKAKAEASLYQDRYDDARDLINLQVTRQRKLYDEALEKLRMLESSMESAEENLRAATVGFEAGVIETGTVLMAQTGWLQAHIGYLDAGVELQRAASQLMKAEGRYVSDLKADEKNPNNR